MLSYPIPETESARLDALYQYQILDTQDEELFDNITLLASHICQAPISLISLVDKDRQWFKSKHGLSATETARDISICTHAIMEPELFIVPDASLDSRFRDTPLIAGDPHIRFYAGAPLVTPQGHAIGSLCVIDRKPGNLNADQKKALYALSQQVVALLEMRRTTQELSRHIADKQKVTQELRTSQQHLELYLRKRTTELAKTKLSVEKFNEERDQSVREAAFWKKQYEASAILTNQINFYWIPTQDHFALIGNLEELLGYAPEHFSSGYREWADLIHPDDSLQFEEALQQLLENKKERILLNYRVRKQDGQYIPISNKLAVISDKEHKVERIIGVIEKPDKFSELNKMKQKFIEATSHELRTPLTILEMGLNILDKKTKTKADEQVSLMVVKLQKATERLNHVITSLLNFSNLESSSLAANTTFVDLSNLLRNCVSKNQRLRESKISVTFSGSNETKFVLADAHLIERVMDQVLANALNFAENKINIALSGGANAEEITVIVSDDGPGVPDDQLSHIFESFVQINRPFGGAGYKGMGLGLALCKKIISLHKGHIWAQNKTDGFQILFTLPTAEQKHSALSLSF